MTEAEYDSRPWDWLHKFEMQIITTYHWSLHDIDNTDVESLIGLVGYVSRRSRAEVSNAGHGEWQYITIGGKRLKRADVDAVNWM